MKFQLFGFQIEITRMPPEDTTVEGIETQIFSAVKTQDVMCWIVTEKDGVETYQEITEEDYDALGLKGAPALPPNTKAYKDFKWDTPSGRLEKGALWIDKSGQKVIGLTDKLGNDIHVALPADKISGDGVSITSSDTFVTQGGKVFQIINGKLIQ